MADHVHIHPAGCSFWYSTDGGSNYTQVFDLKSIEGAKMERGESDDTTLNSPNKFILATPGWKKGGDVNMSVYLRKELNVVMLALWTAGTTVLWRALFVVIEAESNGSKWEFAAWIKTYPIFSKVEKGSDEKVSLDLVLHLTTEPTFMSGS